MELSEGYATLSQLLPGINAMDHPTSVVITITDEDSEEQLEDTEFYEISICQLYVFFMIKCITDIEAPKPREDMVETEGVPRIMKSKTMNSDDFPALNDISNVVDLRLFEMGRQHDKDNSEIEPIFSYDILKQEDNHFYDIYFCQL